MGILSPKYTTQSLLNIYLGVFGKQLKQPWGIVTTTPVATCGGKQSAFGSQYCGAASATVLSAKCRGCRGVVGSLKRGSLMLLLLGGRVLPY